MIRDRFTFSAPRSADEAISVLAGAEEGAVLVGGGTWVVPEMTRGRRRPRHVVDLRRAGLSGVRVEDGHLSLGPMTTYSNLAASQDVPGLLRTLAQGVTGGAQIRNQGTLGGSACYANPASDVPAALLALAATFRMRRAAGERDVPAAAFFRAAFEADVSSDEVLVDIRMSRPRPGSRYGYVKFKLAEGSWPIVTAACIAGADGTVESLAVGGAAAVPVSVEVPDGADDEQIMDAAREAVGDGWTDALADGTYRRRIAGVIAKRAVHAARGETGGLT